MKTYTIETTTGHLLAKDADKESAIIKARNIEPNDTLIRVKHREDGTQAGFVVGKLVGMGF